MRDVIIVDDEYWALKGLETIVPWERYGYEVKGCYDDSIEAFDAMCAWMPSVVFTDIRMPGLSGLDLLRLSRARGIFSTFVIITGYSEFEYAQQAIRNGAFDYILKPITYEDAASLLDRLEKHWEVISAQPSMSPEFVFSSNPKLNELLEYVRVHYQKPLRLKELAEQFHMNPTYCSELINTALGMSFTKYVNQLRLSRCCTLLDNTDLSIEEIAFQSGFADYSNFHKVFKAAHGMSPLQYRKRERSL